LTTASTVELDLVLVSSAALAIASDQLRGDLFDRAFKFRGERSHLFAALERPLFFRLARGQLHRLDFERIVPKDLDCFDHPSDFIAPLAMAQLHSGGADRKFLHCMGNRGDRFDDRFGDTGSYRGKNTSHGALRD